MKSKSIQILIIEDNHRDADLIQNALEQSNLDCSITHSETLEEGIREIKKGHVDSILLDPGLPDSSGIESLTRITELGTDCSIVILTGNLNEQLGVEAMKKGAHDYVLKSNLDPAALPRIIRYAYERKEVERLLQKHQHILEREVEKRSSELMDTNRKLRQEIEIRKNTETRIRETTLFLQTMINTIPVPIFYKDMQGIYLGGNHAFFSFLGRQANEVIGKTVHEVIQDKTFADVVIKMDNRLIQSGTKQVYEAKAKKGTGEVRDVILHKTAYKNSDGETAGIVGIFIDVTENRMMTRELTELKEHLQEQVSKRTAQLEEANATKDKFFSIIAHDLKSPFNIIHGFLNLIHDEFDEFNSQELKEFISRTLEASTNTFSLLENLLAWSRSQRGTIEHRPVRTNLCEICDEVIHCNAETAKNKNIRIINNISHDHLAFADANMIRTIIRNLITNALKFSYPAGDIKISSKIEGDKVVMCVQDNGIGMSKDYVEKLFVINEKTQRQGTYNEKGTGLGLILCKEFVEKNQGELWVESHENEGSSFYFSLPMATGSDDSRYAV